MSATLTPRRPGQRPRSGLPGRALLLAACAAALVVPASAGARSPATLARSRFLMGTSLTIEAVLPAPEQAFEAAFDEVARLEDVMSNWRDGSEIARLNRTAARAPFRCSRDLLAGVEAAIGWAEATQGAFDPTVEPLVRRFRLRGPEGRLPGVTPAGEGDDGPGPEGAPGDEPPVGWGHVRLDRATSTVSFDAPGVGIDFGGIGKGIALDAAARVLADRGVRAALLDFGGQVLAMGPAPDGEGWRIGIADPADRERVEAAVRVRDASVATSGNGERARRTSAGPVGHILDPALRKPARFTGSLTVLAPNATSADALSTALFVMGPVRGARWAEERGLAALYLWQGADGTLHRRATPPFEVLARGERRGGGAGRGSAVPQRGRP